MTNGDEVVELTSIHHSLEWGFKKGSNV